MSHHPSLNTSSSCKGAKILNLSHQVIHPAIQQASCFQSLFADSFVHPATLERACLLACLLAERPMVLTGWHNPVFLEWEKERTKWHSLKRLFSWSEQSWDLSVSESQHEPALLPLGSTWLGRPSLFIVSKDYEFDVFCCWWICSSIKLDGWIDR